MRRSRTATSSLALQDLRTESPSSVAGSSSSTSSLRTLAPTPTPARFLRHPQSTDDTPTSISNVPSSVTSGSRSSTGADLLHDSVEHQHLLEPSDEDTVVAHTPSKARMSKQKFRRSDSHLHRTIYPHSPIPGVDVFARDAPPLHLPKLDHYISSFPAPPFSSTKSGKPQMFKPMDKLAASKLSIEDLQHNSTVPPFWRNRTSFLSWSVDAVLGLTGSSLLTTYYSLTGVANTVQIFALIITTLVPVDPASLSEYWRKLLLGTIPNILALNFASGVVQSLIFLLVFMSLAGVLLYYFRRAMVDSERYKLFEGLQSPPRSSQWGAIAVTFVLTLIYLPLSTIAVHVLVWSADLWVIDNPYTNATTFPPDVASLGPSNEYRQPLDFCYTTTMKKNEVNFAPLAVVGAALTFVFLTIWFPIALLKVIRRSTPRVAKYNEMGRRRSKVDMEHEYQAILERDQNPFAFLYKGFRRDLGFYQPFYLFIKLSTLVIVAVFSPDNCIFRNVSRSTISIVSQVGLCLFTVFLLVLQSFWAPFLDPVSNASEWVGRVNFVMTSAITLAITCNAPGSDILNTWVLWTIYIITYLLSFYFVIINLGLVQRLVKRWSSRVDFSIDIFSPRLDLTSNSIHLRRRIWQESITALFLTSKECRIPKKQPMVFSESRHTEYPPYLLNFRGTPGERHVENLKILSEIGVVAYRRAFQLVSGPDATRYERVAEAIQRHYLGPDSYWEPPKHIHGCTKYWGNSWWVPFPKSLVFRYDEGPVIVLTDLKDLEKFIVQNSRHEIQKRRQVRLALRALENQQVYWPYEHNSLIGKESSFWCCGRGYSARSSVYVDRGKLKIRRRGLAKWKKLHLGSGFDVELVYNKSVTINGDALGLEEDFDLTPLLAQFLGLNEAIIASRLPTIEATIQEYRDHLWKECKWKVDVLSYGFLMRVYDQPREPDGLAASTIHPEQDLRVRELMLANESAFQAAHERFKAVSRFEATAWWYIFWDDFWRRNHTAFPALSTYELDFNPHFPTSLAYKPLPRAALESFLVQRGLMSKRKGKKTVFNSGLLNKLYFRLNETVFDHSSRAIMFHLGKGREEYDMDEVDLEVNAGPSTMGTGGGTDYDDDMRPRPEYRWEALLTDPLRETQGHKNILAKLKAWFGLSPVWKARIPSQGLALDLQLQNGRYVLLDEDPPHRSHL